MTPIYKYIFLELIQLLLFLFSYSYIYILIYYVWGMRYYMDTIYLIIVFRKDFRFVSPKWLKCQFFVYWLSRYHVDKNNCIFINGLCVCVRVCCFLFNFMNALTWRCGRLRGQFYLSTNSERPFGKTLPAKWTLTSSVVSEWVCVYCIYVCVYNMSYYILNSTK